MLYGAQPEVTVKPGEIVHGFKFTVHNPPKSAILRLPTPQEILDRLSQQKSIRTNLGRGKSKSAPVPNPKADLALFERIRVSGDDFDADEAADAIAKLTAHEAIECNRTPEGYSVKLKTPFGHPESVPGDDEQIYVTTHSIKIPTVAAMSAYRGSVIDPTDLPHGREEIRFRVEPAVKVYDEFIISTTGYEEGTPVPPHHKSAVVIEVLNAYDQLNRTFDPN